MSSAKHQIHTLEKSKVEESTNRIFAPTGTLFDCKGRCAAGSKGVCNQCRFRHEAVEAELKYTDKKKKTKLYDSINRKEGIDLKRARTELSAIRNK